MMDTIEKESSEQATLREYCRTWLTVNHSGNVPVPLSLGVPQLKDPAAMAWLQVWQTSAYDAGLIRCDNPSLSDQKMVRARIKAFRDVGMR
jgi:hypothetical protein